jgi:uncharacterized protein YjbI with pentapeptide repeats
MVSIKKLLLCTAFIVSIGFIPMFICVQSRPAYGYSEQDLKRLEETKMCPKCDLTDAPLSNTYLFGVLLTGADLTDAKLPGANLHEAYLQDAKLSGADLTDANLSIVVLNGADLSVTPELPGAKLPGANLQNANLSGANLSGAFMGGVILTGAKVKDADFQGAQGLTSEQKKYLREHGAINVPK